MADTEIAPTNEKVVFKGKPAKEAAVPGDGGEKSKPKVKAKAKGGATKRANDLLRTGAISQKQHTKMIGNVAPATGAPAPAADPELDMSDDD